MRCVTTLTFLLLAFNVGQCQLPIGTIIPAMNAGSQVMNMLPPQARDCVNKVSTQAVTDSLVSKLASSFGSLLGGSAPTITRDPGTLVCKDGVPYYKETTHLRGQFSFAGTPVPIDLPMTTETKLSTCFENGIPNPCTVANGLLGPNGGNILNGVLGSNKPNPKPSVGGNTLGQLFQKRPS